MFILKKHIIPFFITPLLCGRADIHHKMGIGIIAVALLINPYSYAKDVPPGIDGSNNNTLHDYDLNKKSTSKKEEEIDHKLKEVYNYEDGWEKYRLLDHVQGISDKIMSFAINDFVFNTPQDYFVVRINPIPKLITEEDKKPLEFYNIASLALQSDLQCPVTPTVKKQDINKPESFHITNNLRRAVKTTFIASGDIIYIKGRVQDVNCVPIQNAIVNIWQTDGYGNLEADKKRDIYFLGNGTATSDNAGNFSFITILPEQSKGIEDIAPHINISVSHRKFRNIDTKIYFTKNILNETDKTLAELDEFSKSLIMAELIPVEFSRLEEGYFMMFDLTLNGVSSYRNL